MNKFGWMLVKDKFWESYETNRLIEEFQKQDIDIQLVDPNTVDIFVNKENKKSILVNGEPSDLPQFVFPRTGSGTTYYIKAVIRHFERMGVPVINSSDAIDNVKDKLNSLNDKFLGERGLYHGISSLRNRAKDMKESMVKLLKSKQIIK